MPKIEQQRGGKQPRKPKAGASVADRLGPMDTTLPPLKICVYGQSGTGKTEFWSTFKKPICAAISSGIGMNELIGIRHKAGIEAVELLNDSDLPDLVNIQRTTGKYATFVVDHITGFQDLVLKSALGMADTPVQLQWGTATQEQWGAIGIRMKTLLRDVLSLDCDVVLISQEREFNTDKNVSDVLRPYVNCALSPSVTGWVGPSVDYLMNSFIRNKIEYQEIEIAGKKIKTPIETKDVEFCLRTGPHAVYKTKFKAPKGTKIPDCIVDPDYTKIRKLVDGQKGV